MKHSLISEDDKSFHVHDGKGHFLVAKHALGKQMIDKIRGLPKYAEGGEVVAEEPSRSPASVMDYINGFVNQSNAAANKASIAAEDEMKAKAEPGSMFAGVDKEKAAKEEAAAIAAESKSVDDEAAMMYNAISEAGPKPASVSAPVAVPVPTPVPQPKTLPQQQLLNEFTANQKAQIHAIEAEGAVQQKLAQEQDKVLGSLYDPAQEAAQKARLVELQAKEKELDHDNEQLYKAAINNKIDPNRAWNNKSTPNKIMSVFAIILGGAGSGGKAENNAALNIINKQIDQDIQAQIEDKNNKNTLYQLNLQKYRDNLSAQQATQMQLNAIAQGHLASIAAKYNSPMIAARVEGLAAGLKQNELASKAALMQGIAQQQQQMAMDPVMAKISRLPEKEHAAALKELADYDQMKGSLKEIDRIMAGMGNVSTTDRLNPFTPDQMAQKSSALVGVIKPMLGEAMQEADVKRMIAPFIPGLLSNNEQARTKAATELKAQVLSRAPGKTPLLTRLGIVPKMTNINATPVKNVPKR